LQNAHRKKEEGENMNKTPLHYQTITELARSIRQGEVSPVELTEHYLARIEALEAKLNAYRLVCSDRAIDEARVAEGALHAGKDLGVLHGIPYAAKDLFDVKGLPTTAGTSLFEKNIAARNAQANHKLAQAGMILLGKTNTVQFAYGGVGINHDHGTPHNPWSQIHHVPFRGVRAAAPLWQWSLEWCPWRWEPTPEDRYASLLPYVVQWV
jgi:aspartyl-tRNA(Asn)/glutamyl-tRNA(Gln) amidotransferase subunit A